ncbi:MAG: hypothetical protein D6808_01500 [Candidatus Dadabacteria bacterium]|nr:MAG: hypothetical protein D6808_01500 [Candidatus Dadabacteria bacterium]
MLKTLTYTSLDASVLKALALKIKTLNPDTIYIPDAFPLVHGILQELHNVNLTNKKIFSVYSAQSQDILDAVGTFGEGLLYSYPKIGDKDALKYFPRLAAKIVNEIVGQCGSKDADCAIKYLKSNYHFDQFGVLKGSLGLKTIHNGNFEWYKR